MVATTDFEEMQALLPKLADDIAAIGVGLLQAHHIIETVRAQVPESSASLAGLLPLCAAGGPALVQLAGLLRASMLVERGEWARIVDALGEPAPYSS